MSDLISIIVPVYNTGECLKKSINSILEQEYENIELVIIDDGSTDKETIFALKELSLQSNKTKVYHKKNGGAASARNFGIERASGKYIGFVDSDDYIDKDMYSTLIKHIQKYDAAIAIAGFDFDDGKPIVGAQSVGTISCLDNSELLHFFLLGNWDSSCICLYSRDVIGDLRFPEGEINEDYIFNYNVFLKSKLTVVDPHIYYHYVVRSNSVTKSDININCLDWVRHVDDIRLDLQKRNILDRYISEMDYQSVFCCVVLANKALLNLKKNHTPFAEEIYWMMVNRIRLIKGATSNIYLNTRYRLMTCSLRYFPRIYRFFVINLLLNYYSPRNR